MNIFNMINCRILDPVVTPMQDIPEGATEEETAELVEANKEANAHQFNIFTRFYQNWWFWIILFAELNVQFFMVGYEAMGYFFGTTPLTFSMHMTAVALGLGSWAICAIIKLTGPKLINAMPEMGEDIEALEKAKGISNAAHNSVQIVDKEEEEDEEKDTEMEHTDSQQEEEGLPASETNGVMPQDLQSSPCAVKRKCKPISQWTSW